MSTNNINYIPESTRTKTERIAVFNNINYIPESIRTKTEHISIYNIKNHDNLSRNLKKCDLNIPAVYKDCKVCHQSTCIKQITCNGYCITCYTNKLECY